MVNSKHIRVCYVMSPPDKWYQHHFTQHWRKKNINVNMTKGVPQPELQNAVAYYIFPCFLPTFYKFWFISELLDSYNNLWLLQLACRTTATDWWLLLRSSVSELMMIYSVYLDITNTKTENIYINTWCVVCSVTIAGLGKKFIMIMFGIWWWLLTTNECREAQLHNC